MASVMKSTFIFQAQMALTTQADDVEELELFSIHFHLRITTSEFQKYDVLETDL